MFCDLVSSTALAERIDDEDLREIVQRYYDVCAETVRRYDGHVANYLGDGVLAYFGWPRAHEDDAERALRAGLDLLGRDFAELNATLEAEGGVRLATRLGVHTGPVVVGDMAGGPRREAMALGETVNLAARLQAAAAPDTLVISGTTLRLVQGIFVTEDLGRQQMKGVAEPVAVYRVVQSSGVRSRLDAAAGRLTPFVGRQAELGTLAECWKRVAQGTGQTALVTGEAGVGKSRLVYQLRAQLAAEPHTWLECRCSPYTQGTAFHPVIELLEHGLLFAAGDSGAEKLGKLERALATIGMPSADLVPLLAEFLGLPPEAGYAPLAMSPELKRRRTLESLVAWVLRLGQLQAVVVLVEDLHWCDPSSVELFGRLAEHSPTSHVLLIGTARPDFHNPWTAGPNLALLALHRLPRSQAREMVARMSPGPALPDRVAERLVAQADGVPLYLEELTRMVLESGLLAEREGRYEMTAALDHLAIPATLHDSLVARLDRLSAAKEVAQRAAVLGREFSYALLAATAELDEPTLRHGLDRLVEAELVFARGTPPDASYSFKHALVQEAAYQSLLRRTRKVLHGRVVGALIEKFPERAAAEPEVVARHAEAAGRVEEAIVYYQRAGEQAQARSALAEALRHLGKAIALLATRPEGAERDAREVALQLALGSSLIAARGYAHTETETAYERARVLCEGVGDATRLGLARVGLAVFYGNRGEVERAGQLGAAVVAAAEETGDTELAVYGHVQVAFPEYCQGKFASALVHAEAARELYDPRRHHASTYMLGTDQGTAARGWGGSSLWHRGHPDRALARCAEGVALARQLGHPFSLASALVFATAVHWLRRDIVAQRERSAEVIALSEAQGFPFWLGVGKAWHGAARVAGGESGMVAEIMEGLALGAETGSQICAPMLFGLLAEAQTAAGQLAEALGTVETGLAVAAQTGQTLHDADLHRLKGELVRASGGAVDEAEALFHRALEIARAQGSRSFELRAATSLARVLRDRGRPAEARGLLAPVYAVFTEGFDTGDLVAAKALLEELT